MTYHYGTYSLEIILRRNRTSENSNYSQLFGFTALKLIKEAQRVYGLGVQVDIINIISRIGESKIE